jgi:hypothetical protein
MTNFLKKYSTIMACVEQNSLANDDNNALRTCNNRNTTKFVSRKYDGTQQNELPSTSDVNGGAQGAGERVRGRSDSRF